jgi:hypothetical protein
LFRLAGHLKKSVGEILETMDSDELTDWMAFARIEPLDGYRNDINFASLQSLLGNCNRGSSQKAFTIEDFLPDYFKENKPEQTPEDMERSLLAWVKAAGGEIK